MSLRDRYRWADSDRDEGWRFLLSILPTVDFPRCRPARASVSAILTLPMVGTEDLQSLHQVPHQIGKAIHRLRHLQ